MCSAEGVPLNYFYYSESAQHLLYIIHLIISHSTIYIYMHWLALFYTISPAPFFYRAAVPPPLFSVLFFRLIHRARRTIYSLSLSSSREYTYIYTTTCIGFCAIPAALVARPGYQECRHENKTRAGIPCKIDRRRAATIYFLWWPIERERNFFCFCFFLYNF